VLYYCSFGGRNQTNTSQVSIPQEVSNAVVAYVVTLRKSCWKITACCWSHSGFVI